MENKSLIKRLASSLIKDPISYAAVVALGIAGYGIYRVISADQAINEAFFKLVDTNRDGTISAEEKRPVVDYFLNNANSSYLIGYPQVSEMREKGVNADLDNSTKRAYLLAKGIEGNFWSGIEF